MQYRILHMCYEYLVLSVVVLVAAMIACSNFDGMSTQTVGTFEILGIKASSISSAGVGR